ncbi:MAG: hypothetical protein WC804_06715 [Sphingomonas sp.]|jgi:hypothetical protein
MRTFLRSGFTWRLVGGFVLGALSVAAFHPAGAAPAPRHDIATTAHGL